MLFAFTTFWAYIWVCQYLMVWYGNIPEEVTHYAARTNGPWLWLFLLNVGLNWLVPFCLLMSGRAKSSRPRLIVVTVTLLAGHWLDLYLLVNAGHVAGPADRNLGSGYACGLRRSGLAVVSRTLRDAPMVPLHDPVLASIGPRPRSAHSIPGGGARTMTHWKIWRVAIFLGTSLGVCGRCTGRARRPSPTCQTGCLKQRPMAG